MEAIEEKKAEEIESEPAPAKEASKTSDIEEVLGKAGHSIKTHQNGLTLGIRLSGIRGTRGVHVEVVHVLDLRRAMFGRSVLAMQAGILESINRPLDSILRDVDLEDLLEEKTLMSPAGKVEFPILRSPHNDSASLVHETRTVYTVFADGTTPRDVSWLAEDSRVIPASELSLLLTSDSRSLGNDVQKSVVADKWDDLEHGVRRAWTGLLPILMGVLGMVGVVSSLLSTSGTLWMPLIVTGVSLPLGLFLLRGAKSSIETFQESFDSEMTGMSLVGDMTKVQNSVSENELRLHLVGSLNFIVTPLMDGAASALEEGDIDVSVVSLGSVLDECVRLSPMSSDTEPPLSGDPGLEKFLSLFKNLGLEFIDGEEAGLGIAYVGLTGHVTNAVQEPEVMQHLAMLNNVLYAVGALSPEVKGRIDDMMNARARDVIMEKFEKDLDEPEDRFAEETEIVQEEEESKESDEMDDLLVDMSEAGVDEPKPEPEETIEDEMPVLVAKTVLEPEPEIIQEELVTEAESEPVSQGADVVKRRNKERGAAGA
ncbi:MAG: hypothetical protein ACXADS_10105 [Candidatus Thorarchaeota archaeon]